MKLRNRIGVALAGLAMVVSPLAVAPAANAVETKAVSSVTVQTAPKVGPVKFTRLCNVYSGETCVYLCPGQGGAWKQAWFWVPGTPGYWSYQWWRPYNSGRSCGWFAAYP